MWLLDEFIADLRRGIPVIDAADIDHLRDRLDDYDFGPPEEALRDEAFDLLRQGRRPDAIVILEQISHPKWHGVGSCQFQYDAHMEAQRAATSGKHP